MSCGWTNMYVWRYVCTYTHKQKHTYIHTMKNIYKLPPIPNIFWWYINFKVLKHHPSSLTAQYHCEKKATEFPEQKHYLSAPRCLVVSTITTSSHHWHGGILETSVRRNQIAHHLPQSEVDESDAITPTAQLISFSRLNKTFMQTSSTVCWIFLSDSTRTHTWMDLAWKPVINYAPTLTQMLAHAHN